MRTRWKVMVGLAAIALVAFGGFLSYASNQAANFLAQSLTVGGETAQGSGWPAPERPEDIGYVGDPQAAFGYQFEDIALPTDIGDMPAWLVPPAEGMENADRWAIFVHGIGGRRENGYRFLPVLHDAGLPVLMLAYRNDEGAPAAPEGVYAFGLTEWRDLDAAVGYAVANGAGSVVLVAESMGGGIVGQFLRRSERAQRVAAIVLDAPAIDFPGVMLDQMRRLGVPLAPLVGRGGTWLFAWRTGVDFGDAVVAGPLAGFTGPLFLSHGSADRLVPVATSDWLARERRSPTEYLRTEADHILSWKEDPARYDAALSGFLATVP
jgi:pimeloyl-ACP methyl ester carboxylesterase